MANLYHCITGNLFKGFHLYCESEPEWMKSEHAYFNDKLNEGIWVIGFPEIVNGKLAIKGFPCKEFESLKAHAVAQSFKQGESPTGLPLMPALYVEMETFSKSLGTTDVNGNLIFENDYLIHPSEPKEFEATRFGRVGNIKCFYTVRKGEITPKPLIVDVNIFDNIRECTVCGTVFDNKELYKLFG